MTIEAWERAHTEAVRAGDSLAAAGAASRVALHLMMDTALMAPIRGWVKRAERLLEGQRRDPTHAWVASSRGRAAAADVGDVRAAGALGGSCDRDRIERQPAARPLSVGWSRRTP